MKKLILTLFVIAFLSSCSSDGNSNIDNYSNLERVDITISNEDFHLTEYYSNEDKLIKVSTNTSEIIHTYDTNDNITQITSSYNGDISSKLTFNYDDTGKVISVHDFESQHSPQHQDRMITWVDNKMIVPLKWDIENKFELTFNDENLLINLKYITQSGEIGLNYNYEYDENENMIRKYGEHWSHSFNVAYYYDNKNNPFYPYFKKYQMVNMILFQGTKLDKSIQMFAKNNNLNYKNLITDTFSSAYQEHTYNGNTTTQTKIKTTEDDSFEVVYDFYYD